MKKVLKILTLIMLILTIVKITDTYAKYFTKASGTLEQEIGKWVINLNEVDIYSDTGETIDFTIEPDPTIVTSANTAPGKISPASTWYSDVILKSEGTDVAVRYDVEFDISHLQDLSIGTGVSVVGVAKDIIRTGENTYTGIISLADVQEGKLETIRCSIIWSNDENKNSEDTALGELTGQKFEVPIKITCTQYLGETITEYVE